MLGVQKVHLVFDNEAAKEGKDARAGTQAARYVARQCAGVKGIEIEIHNPPATDPSDCRCDRRTALALRNQLRRLFPVAEVSDELGCV
jgi:hypothetical protein